jgi:hypothetical protein
MMKVGEGSQKGVGGIRDATLTTGSGQRNYLQKYV